MELIIKNKSQSFEQIVIDLNTYLRSLPDWEAWQDYYKTGSGQTIIELIAGLGSQLFYFINILRQETYLQTAVNRSSIVGISQMLGYSVGRGNAVKATITVTPDSTGVYEKFDIIGQCKDKDIILAESVLINEGVQKQLSIIIGTLKRDYCKIPSSALQPFRMTAENISEDYILYKTANTYTNAELENIKEDLEYDKTGWIELPTSSKMIDMINDKYVVQTNVLSAVDIFYLNEGSGTHAYPYRQEETLFIDYIELSDTDFSLSDLNFFYGNVNSVDSVASYNAVEPIKSIKVNAPLANETQALIRARNDAEKLVQQYGKNYLSTVNTRDISPEKIDVTYIKSDYTLLSEIEYNELYDYLFNVVRPFGINMPFISPPVRAILELEIEVELLNTLVLSQIQENIASMVGSLESKFIVNNKGQLTQLDLSLVEQQIEDLYGVKIARIYIANSVYEANTYYRIGQFVRSSIDSDLLFKLQDIVFTSGYTEPIWPTKEGDIIIDGDIEWICKKLIEGSGNKWQANTSYGTSNIVLPSIENGYMYEFHYYVSNSGNEEPPVPQEGKIVTYDNELIWFQIDKNASAKEWQANTSYRVGSIIDISSDEDHSYEMIGLRAKSSLTEIDWPTTVGETIQIGNMIWKAYNGIDARGNYLNPLLDYKWNQYLHVDYSLQING